jgi:hypothetical protein
MGEGGKDSRLPAQAWLVEMSHAHFKLFPKYEFIPEGLCVCPSIVEIALLSRPRRKCVLARSSLLLLSYAVRSVLFKCTEMGKLAAPAPLLQNRVVLQEAESLLSHSEVSVFRTRLGRVAAGNMCH